MPIARYFATIGSLLVAMLFVANWYFPEPPVSFRDSRIEAKAIRIKSAHKWPDKIVFDTNRQMPEVGIVPATENLAQTVPDAEAGKSDLEAFAQLKPPASLASTSHTRRRQKVKRGSRLTRLVVLPVIQTRQLGAQYRRVHLPADRGIGAF